MNPNIPTTQRDPLDPNLITPALQNVDQPAGISKHLHSVDTDSGIEENIYERDKSSLNKDESYQTLDNKTISTHTKEKINPFNVRGVPGCHHCGGSGWIDAKKPHPCNECAKQTVPIIDTYMTKVGVPAKEVVENVNVTKTIQVIEERPVTKFVEETKFIPVTKMVEVVEEVQPVTTTIPTTVYETVREVPLTRNLEYTQNVEVRQQIPVTTTAKVTKEVPLTRNVEVIKTVPIVKTKQVTEDVPLIEQVHVTKNIPVTVVENYPGGVENLQINQPAEVKIIKTEVLYGVKGCNQCGGEGKIPSKKTKGKMRACAQCTKDTGNCIICQNTGLRLDNTAKRCNCQYGGTKTTKKRKEVTVVT